MRKLSLILILVAAAGCATSRYTTTPPPAPARGYNDSFVSPEGRQELVIEPNRVGVLAVPSAGDEAVKAVVATTQLRVVSNKHNLYVLDAGGAQSRAELVTIARALRARAPEVIAQAGLVVRQPGAKDPSIATDDFVVGIEPGQNIEEIAARLGARVLMKNPYRSDQYLLRLDPATPTDTIAVTRQLAEQGGVAYAYPNFVHIFVDNEQIFDDTLFGSLWHLRNTGQSGGTATADSRASLAWDFTLGTGTIIAVIENGGFDTAHADLTPNFWTNAGEIAGNGIDDDANGCVDDVNGCNFGPCDVTPGPTCGNNAIGPADASEGHGTSVASVAGARGNNAAGVSGSCPRCNLMLLRTGYAATDFAKGLAFGYAQTEGAHVVTNSWGYDGSLPAVTTAIGTAATSGRGGLGLIILKSSGNANNDGCFAPTVSDTNLIAVTSSSNQDRKVVQARYGNCVDLMSPSHRGYSSADPFTGTLAVTAADRTGAAGYNNTNPANAAFTSGLTEVADQAYTNFFGGTSSATPLAAGVAALVVNARPAITRTQLQNLLQDTADKIEPGIAAYQATNGFSAPSTSSSTHAYGRVNAFEAVRVTAPAASGGKDGVDVFLRDNRLDWGNTDHTSNTLLEATRGFIPHWESVDIKIDAPPFIAAPTTNAAFEAFVDQNPTANTLNKVHVRIRNRGPVAANGIVKLHWVFAGTALPALPSDFWTQFPADSGTTSVWHPIPSQSFTALAYSGASVANGAGDAAQIFTFDFNAPPIDPALPNFRHHCLFAVVDSPADRPLPKTHAPTASEHIPDYITPRDNNVAHRNVALYNAGEPGSADSFFVTNPFDENATVKLTIDAPRGAQVRLQGIEPGREVQLAPGQKIVVTATVINPDPKNGTDVRVIQETRAGGETIIGGFTFRFAPPPPLEERRDYKKY
jgi:hypothetical protein